MSLKTLDKIEKSIAARPAQLESARKSGKKVVGWLNYNVPVEIIHSLGLIPVHLGTGGNDRLVELGSRWISSMNCVFTRQTVGLFAENTDPYVAASDFVVIDATCKQLYRVAEIVKHYFNRDVLILGVPHNFDVPEGREYFRKEVESFTRKVELYSGNKLDAVKLSESIKLFADIRRLTVELYKIQSSAESPISWRDTYEVVQAGYWLDAEEYRGLLEELHAEIASYSGPSAVNPDAPRILLVGSIIPPGDRKLISLIEDSGGRIVADDLWSGLTPNIGVTVKHASAAAVADAYLDRVPHSSLPHLDLETDRRVKNTVTLAKDYRVHGVIYHTLRYCDPFTFKANELKNILFNEGFPFLEIHTEYAGSDLEAIRTRLEAFVEVLQAKAESVEA